MLKYCNGYKRDLQIDKFFSCKKNTCKNCVKKIKCDFCGEKFISTILSQHIKQNYSTYIISRTNDGSRSNDSTYNENDHKANIRFNSLKNNRKFKKMKKKYLKEVHFPQKVEYYMVN